LWEKEAVDCHPDEPRQRCARVTNDLFCEQGGGVFFVPGKSSGVFLLVCRCFVQTTGFPLENIALLCDDIVHCNRQPTYQTAYKLFIVTYC